MKKTITDIIHLARETGRKFNENDPIMLAGALAFFTVFATPPIFIIIIYIISFFTGHQTATTEVFNQLQELMGQSGAHVLQNIVNHYFVPNQNIFQRVIRIGIFIFASSSFFIIIQHALNRIWNVKPVARNNVMKILKNRALSFGIILLMGIILMISVLAQTVFLSINTKLHALSPLLTPFVLRALSILSSFLLGTLSFGVIFKFLPDVIIEWKVVWVGAAVTSFLFLVGNRLISIALGGTSIKAMYGTAGSMAIFLLWVFYSSLILFLGAEITQQYAQSFAETIQPKEHAVKVTTQEQEVEKV